MSEHFIRYIFQGNGKHSIKASWRHMLFVFAFCADAAQLASIARLYQEKKNKIILSEKYAYLARYQTFFVESFGSPFTMSVPWEDGLGRLFSCLSSDKRDSLILLRSHFSHSRRNGEYFLLSAAFSGVFFPLTTTVLLLSNSLASFSLKRKIYSEAPAPDQLKRYLSGTHLEQKIDRSSFYAFSALCALSLLKLLRV